MKMRPRPLVVIDDNDDDRFILTTVLDKVGPAHPVHEFAKAEDAMAFLSTSGDAPDSDRSVLPLACFVDVRMGGFNGFEFVEWVRNHAVFARMALIVMSASEHPADLSTAAKLGAQCYALKFPRPAVMRDLLRACEGFRLAPGTSAVFPLPCNLLPRAAAPGRSLTGTRDFTDPPLLKMSDGGAGRFSRTPGWRAPAGLGHSPALPHADSQAHRAARRGQR